MNGESNPDEDRRDPDIHEPGDRDREISSPQAVLRQFERFVAGSITQRTSHHHPIFDKFESEHVTQFLTNSYKRDIAGKWFGFISVLSAVSLFVFLIIFLAPDSPELYMEILKLAIAFAGGMGAGYGLKAYRDCASPHEAYLPRPAVATAFRRRDG